MSDTTNHDLTDDVSRARYERGREVFDRINTGGGQQVVDALADIAPALAHHIVAYGFGDIYDRPGLVPQQRQLVTIGMLIALGGCEPQLEVHVGTALNVGVTPTEIVETVIHSSGYCGFPKALNAIFVVKRVFAERGLLPL